MFKTLNDMDFQNKKVLVRLDIDVPFGDSGAISDDYRIKKGIPTIQFLIDKGAKQIIMMGHLGRPKGMIVQSLKTDSVAKRISELLGLDVKKVDGCVDIDITDSKLVMLENLRFESDEKNNSVDFSKKLASMADVFVLEAFGVSHREHASIVGVQKFLPSCAGFQLEKEISALDISNAKKPIVALFGAAKISDKIKLISKLLERVDTLLLGGAAIFTFYKSKGIEIGKSLVDMEHLDLAKKLMENPKIVLPDDIVIAKEANEDAVSKTVSFENIPKDYIGLDIGEKSVKKYKDILKNAKTIIWNGPMGMFEIPQFAKATKDIEGFIASLDDVTSIVGGGDTANAIRSMGYEEQFSHVSTGGGASLKLMEGEKLPGIEALIENSKKFN